MNRYLFGKFRANPSLTQIITFSFGSSACWGEFKAKYSTKTIEELKNKPCLSIPVKDISPSIFQRQRFFPQEENKVQVLKLYQNQYRKDLLMNILATIQTKPKETSDILSRKIKMLGPRGVGKSHVMALLVLYLRWEKILKPEKIAFLYINDPSLHFQEFPFFIKRDVEYFLCEQLSDPNNPKWKVINEKFKKVKWTNTNSIRHFLEKAIVELVSQNVEPLAIMDQYNLLERAKSQNNKTYDFLVDLITIFQRIFVCASNNNNTVKQLDDLIAKEIYLSANHIFANEKEVLEYLHHLGYFSEVLSKPDYIKTNLSKIGEYTRFNPLELMKLDETFRNSPTKTIDEDLNEAYFLRRRIDLADSHAKFIKEFLISKEAKESFIELLPFVDSDKSVDPLLWEKADLNLMDITKTDQKIYSIAPVTKRFLESAYQFHLLQKDQALNYARSNYKSYMQTIGPTKGYLFEKCVEYILEMSHDIRQLFYHDPQKQYISFDLDPNVLVQDIIARNNFLFVPTKKNFPCCDFIHFNEKDGTVRLINCTICSMTNKTLEKKDKTTLDALMEIQKNYIEEIKEQAKDPKKKIRNHHFKRFLKEIKDMNESGKLKQKITVELCFIVAHDEQPTSTTIKYIDIRTNELWRNTYLDPQV